MKHYRTLILMAFLCLSFPSKSSAQTFQAYLQVNFKWNGDKFVRSNQQVTSTTLSFVKSQLTIDSYRYTITNRISNTSGDYYVATYNDDPSDKISVVLSLTTEANGKKLKIATVEKAKDFKIVYYIK
ncbi:hypothetical protein [Daejeonella sp. JGW-45]|uniref:hypothetical protein n=1 Tax=Daejeonella sp. JGW-45 TaxID=3034148 RepID=UPI0023ED319D|nr:hypothetical protein [Daejeonella sp. JGW-45]